MVGQRSRLVAADRYSHALVDYGEIVRKTLLDVRVERRLPPATGLVLVLAGLAVVPGSDLRRRVEKAWATAPRRGVRP
jgi:hypothetical protein